MSTSDEAVLDVIAERLAEGAPAAVRGLDKEWYKRTLRDMGVGEVIHECIERRIGEHDMMRCKICGVEGHNEVLGHPYGIKHKPTCAFAKVLRGGA